MASRGLGLRSVVGSVRVRIYPYGGSLNLDERSETILLKVSSNHARDTLGGLERHDFVALSHKELPVKQKTTKIQLHRETVRQLDELTLDAIAGGATLRCGSDGPSQCDWTCGCPSTRYTVTACGNC